MEAISILFNYLKQNSSFNTDEIHTICSFFRVKNVLKGESLFEKGERFSKIVFIAEGVLRTFVHDMNGEEITKHFLTDKEFFTEIESFEYGKPCGFNVSAVSNCKLVTLSKSDSELLSVKIPKWQYVMKDEAVKALNAMIRKQEFLSKGEAIDKYQYFVNNYPNLVKQIPLKYIASYLKITQSTLSRIRKNAW